MSSDGEEEDSSSSSGEVSDEDTVDWEWLLTLKPSRLEESHLKRLLGVFDKWKPPPEQESSELLLMYRLCLGAFKSRDTDLKEALDELSDRGRDEELHEENKQLKKLLKKSKNEKNEDEAMEEILQLEQDISKLKHECAQLEREVNLERGSKETLESRVETLQKERKSLRKEIESLRDEVADSRRSLKDDEAEHQEVELRRVRELEESIRLKNKQIHQLLEDIELVERDNADYQENVVNLRDRLSEAINQINSLTGEYVSSKENIQRLNTLVGGLQSENSRLQTLLDDSYTDKKKRDQNLESLGRRVDQKFEHLSVKLNEKDAEIEELRARLNRVQLNEEQSFENEGQDGFCAHGTGKMVRESVSVLSQAIKEREEQIEALRRDLVQATSELDRSAQVIEDLRSKKKGQDGGSALQKTIIDLQAQLSEANRRMSELEEESQEAREAALEKTEELSECIARLHSFEKGDYGLEQALDEIKVLKKRLSNDEEQIHKLTHSLNVLQYSKGELEEENSELRDQLGLSPRVQPSSFESVGSPKTKGSKGGSQALMQVMQRELERLEEERILLKTENRKLARQMGSKSALIGLTPEDLKSIQEYTDALRYCRRNSGGEEQSGGNSLIETHKKMCGLENELKDLAKLLERREEECSKMTSKYNEMLAENSELRKSMREILDSIKSQDAESNVRIESESLDRILNMLDARHLWGEYHPTMELNTRIQRLEGCNLELRNQLKKARREEERFSIQLSKHVGRIHDLESKLLALNEEPPKREVDKEEAQILPPKNAPGDETDLTSSQVTDKSVKLNFQLIQVLEQLNAKEAFNKKLESEIEGLHSKINVQRHQMGLLYEEHRKKKLSWELDTHKLKEERVEQTDVIKKLSIKVEEYEKDLNDEDVKSDILKKIIILRSNEAMMIRRYRAIEDSEKMLREEVKRLKDESFKMENDITKKLGSLQRYKEMASYKMEALQKSLSQSVQLSELDSIHCQYSELLIKYKSLLQRNPSKDSCIGSEDDVPNTTISHTELQNIKNELSSFKKENESLQAIIDSSNNQESLSSKEISNLEMRELNERQRADWLDRQNALLQPQMAELVERNNNLELKLKGMTEANALLQKCERELQDKIIHNMARDDFEAINEKLKELELSEAKLKLERDELKEISDIATNQIYALEVKKRTENIELEALRHQVIDLQTQTDEKSIMGKLHRQIILLQVRENESAQKIKSLETTASKKDVQLFRQNKKIGEYENLIFKIRIESNKKLKEMYKMIQDLRHRCTGPLVPLLKQESMAKNYLEIFEDKKAIKRSLQKTEEERLEAQMLAEELKIKLGRKSSLTSKDETPLEELKIKEMKSRRKMEHFTREVEYLRKTNDMQSQEIERLEAEVIRKENIFDAKYFSEWDPLEGSYTEVEPIEKPHIVETDDLKPRSVHDEPLAIQLESALKKIKNQSSVISSANRESADMKKENDELRKRIRECEGLLSVKEKALTELRSQIPNTVDKLIATTTATGPSGLPLALTEDYESRQGLKIAQSTVECLRERLKQKEDILARYESTLKFTREEAEKGIRKKDEEIHSLQSRLRIQQSVNNELHTQIQLETDDEKNAFRLNLANQKVQDMEEEVISLHRSVAEYSNKCNQLMRERDKYFAITEDLQEKLDDLGDRSSSSEDISVLRRLNEEIAQLRMELEHMQERENELLQEKSVMETKTKTYPSSKRLEIEERDKKIRSLSKVITDLKSEMLNLRRTDSHEQFLLDEKQRQVSDLSDKVDKLNKTIKHLREKDSSQSKELQKLKDEILNAADKSLSGAPAEMRDILKDRDSLRLKVRRLEQRLETINRPERPLEESSEEQVDESNVEKRVKTAAELARWNESKKWQGKVESLKTKLTDTEVEVSKLNRINKSMKDTISRLERDLTIMRSKLKTSQEKSVSYDVKVDDLTELNEELKRENEILKKSGPISESLETLKLKNKFLNDRIESQERKIAALEITKNKSDTEADFITKVSEIQEKERLCQKEKLELEEKILKLQKESDLSASRKTKEMGEMRLFLEELKVLIYQDDKEDIMVKIDDQLIGNADIKTGKSFIPKRVQNRNKKSIDEELIKLKEMNETLISKVESKNAEISTCQDEIKRLQRLLKNKSRDPSTEECKSESVIELPRQKLNEMETDLKRKSELLNEVKSLLKQAASRERSQTSLNEELQRKVDLLSEVDPKSPSHILAKELRLSKLTIERLQSEKKELEHQIEVLSRN